MPPQIAHIPLTSPVILAPMAGITDLPFRRVVARFGAGLVVSEMVASQEMMQGGALARSRAELGLTEAATAVQLVGRDPYWMGEAARYLAQNGAQIIDINMGCPAKRVTQTGGNGACGSALMREPDLVSAILQAVVAGAGVPVTLKTRLGWDERSLNAPEIAARAEAAGIAMITIHGRTRCQFYKGHADWAAIAAVKAAVRIPVIANGDIIDGATARTALDRSNADGVMVGRGAQGAPWRLAQIGAHLTGAPAPTVPQGADLYDLIAQHYEEILAHYGADLGLRVARKHLGWYLEEAGLWGARAEVLTATDPKTALRLIREALLNTPETNREVAA
jgi:tRNA-dihydrouridine synthase B